MIVQATGNHQGSGGKGFSRRTFFARYVVPDKFKNFPIFAWGFTIGPTITKLYAEWQAK
jgi:hypothetical protein